MPHHLEAFAPKPVPLTTTEGVIVSLTPDELYKAAIVGIHRRITCLFGKRKKAEYFALPGEEWQKEIDGCCAEVVYAKYANQYWTGSIYDGRVAGADVGLNTQVRHCRSNDGKLAIYSTDRDDQFFVLVVGLAPRYRIVGYVKGRVGKTLVVPDAKGDYQIPQDRLKRDFSGGQLRRKRPSQAGPGGSTGPESC